MGNDTPQRDILPVPRTTGDVYLHDIAASLRTVVAIQSNPSEAVELTEPAGTFDPAGYTVAQVNGYLSDATPAERDRVLAAERAGKDRTTIDGT